MNRTVTGIAGVLYGIMQKNKVECTSFDHKVTSRALYCRIFDEHVDGGYCASPSFSQIYAFLLRLYRKAQLEPECLLTALIYLERMTTRSGVRLNARNWERLVFACIVVSSKHWDDVSCNSLSFCRCMRGMTIRELNLMERYLLRQLDYSLYVTPEMYSQIYYELRYIWTHLRMNAVGNPVSIDEAKVKSFGIRPCWGATFLFGCPDKREKQACDNTAGSTKHQMPQKQSARPTVFQTHHVVRHGMSLMNRSLSNYGKFSQHRADVDRIPHA